ncbi:hypothetical protein [Achromobacter ruhlandii]|uniref:hypothetical protein n=1 Tax=Achromobacter ruhlandii TaxID=72557 RepID=UPI001EED6646|nr:hypothetical protein [Achromobacter ruhlandii]MCZ8398756.1 hypothetical protein [Achromobacter ruhlandii]
MKLSRRIISAAALGALATASAWAQGRQPDGNATPPATTAPAPKPMPKAQPGQANPQPQPKAQPGQGDSRAVPKSQSPQGEPRPAKDDRPARRLEGEGGTDSRGPARGQGGTGSTGQGGMPGSGASAGSGGTADTR